MIERLGCENCIRPVNYLEVNGTEADGTETDIFIITSNWGLDIYKAKEKYRQGINNPIFIEIQTNIMENFIPGENAYTSISLESAKEIVEALDYMIKYIENGSSGSF